MPPGQDLGRGEESAQGRDTDNEDHPMLGQHKPTIGNGVADPEEHSNGDYAESFTSQSSPSHRKSAFSREAAAKSSPMLIDRRSSLYRRSSVFSMVDDRPSVITLARSASQHPSKNCGRPTETRLSVDDIPERVARSEADINPMHRSNLDDIEQPFLQQAYDINHDTASEISNESTGLQRKIKWAMNISLVVNVFLLIVKVYAYWASTSKAILASAADSLVDIASQLVIAYAEYKVHTADPKFPVGRTRLEAVGVVSCAVIMTIATIEVIQSSVYDIINGINGKIPALEMGLIMYIILGTASGLKVLLWLYTVALRNTSDSMMALAEDHLNDILSNLSAIICGALASFKVQLWWIDPVGAILISGYIIWSWMSICKNQVDKIVGKGAPEEFVNDLEEMANSHHDLLIVDVIRAYFFGSRFLVEMEVVLPSEMTVRESHDIALKLQHKLEAFDEVERAFVHVDYQMREEPEHKLERNLMNKTSNLFESHDSVHSDVAGDQSQHGRKFKQAD